MTTTTESQKAGQEYKICIVGDLLVDSTHYVEVTKLSPEAPVPVAVLTGEVVETPGGAGLAAAFAARQHIPSIFCTYTNLQRMEWLRSQYHINIHVGTADPLGKTNPIKTRYIDKDSHYHLLRVDNDRTIVPPFKTEEMESIWLAHVEDQLFSGSVKVLAILDYRKGLLSDMRAKKLIETAHQLDIPIYVDSRCDNLGKFTHTDILKLNKEEFARASTLFGAAGSDIIAAQQIIDSLRLKHLIVTLGSEGATLYSAHNLDTYEYVRPPAHEGSPDVTGCGDVFDVTFCYHWGIKELSCNTALIAAVEMATRFAYEPIGERLKCQS